MFHPGAPRFAAKFITSLEAAGVKITPVRVQRPAAKGEAQATLLEPMPGNGHLVIWAHGTGNDRFYPQAHLIKAILQAGFSVFTFDLDGHGRSSTTLLNAENIRSCLPDAVACARTVCSALRVHIVGHSLGGALALDYAATSDSALTSIVAISLPAALAVNARAMAWEAMSVSRPSLYRQMAFYGPLGIWPALGPFKRSTYPLRLATAAAGADGFAYVGVVAEIFANLRLREKAARVHVPALLIRGSADLIATAGAQAMFNESMENATAATIAGETHFTTILCQNTADLLLLWLRKFLAEP